MPSRPDGFWKIIASLLHAAHLILISVLDSLHTVSPAELARSTLRTLLGPQLGATRLACWQASLALLQSSGFT